MKHLKCFSSMTQVAHIERYRGDIMTQSFKLALIFSYVHVGTRTRRGEVALELYSK
jgi:hypothetical protein